MEEALQRSQGNSHAPDLKVSILLDYTRGSRGCFILDLSVAVSTMLIVLIVCCGSYVQDRSTRGPCCCRCCSASPLRCGCLCTTLQTWGGCCGCWSRSASTRPSESSTSRSTCLTTALSSAGMLTPTQKVVRFHTELVCASSNWGPPSSSSPLSALV